jgi:hypothetical protein
MDMRSCKLPAVAAADCADVYHAHVMCVISDAALFLNVSGMVGIMPFVSLLLLLLMLLCMMVLRS